MSMPVFQTQSFDEWKKHYDFMKNEVDKEKKKKLTIKQTIYTALLLGVYVPVVVGLIAFAKKAGEALAGLF